MTFNRLRRCRKVGFGDGHSERVGCCREGQVVTAVRVLYDIDSGGQMGTAGVWTSQVREADRGP